MQRAILPAAAIIIMAMGVFGCEKEKNVPEPQIPDKAALPTINERIEREAEQGTRTGTLPAEQAGEETDRPLSDRDSKR